MSRVYDVTSAEFARKFRAIEQSRPAAVVRGVVSAGLLGAEIVARAAPKDLGNLKRSTRWVTVSPGGYIISDAPHAGIVEMGARPHWAPLKPLIEWALRHGAATPAEAYRMAKAIQMKIATDGQAPTYFTRKKIPQLRKVLNAEVEREIALDKEQK